jgi:hypothetical protein
MKQLITVELHIELGGKSKTQNKKYHHIKNEKE